MINLYIKIEDSQKKTTHLLLETWGKILEMPTNLIKVNDEDGVWRGNVINKSFIVSAEPDYKYSITKKYHEIYNKHKDEKTITDEEKQLYIQIKPILDTCGEKLSENSIEEVKKLFNNNKLLC